MSDVTPIKEAQIHGVVKTRLLQRKDTQNKPKPYIGEVFIYDIFSGDGINVVDGQSVWGSPMEIVKAIRDSGIHSSKRVRFMATDVRDDSVARLRNRIGEVSGFTVECKKAKADEQIARIESDLREFSDSHAIIVVDPNGPAVMPFKELVEIARRFHKRADILINISETAVNRILKCSVTQGKNWWAEMKINGFEDIVSGLLSHYKGAWIRDAIPGDRQRWRLMCFWSFAAPRNGWTSQGLRSVGSIREIDSIFCKEAVQ